MSDYYEFRFQKDSNPANCPPTTEERIIGSLLADIADTASIRDGVEYVAKWNLKLNKPVLFRKPE